MPVTKDNLLIGAGRIKYGAVGAHDALMEDMGATDGGVELVMDRTFVDVKVDQLKGTIRKHESERKLTIRTNLAEPTLKNLLRAWGYPDSALAADGTLSIGDPTSVPEGQLQFFGLGPAGTRRKATFWRMVSVGNGGMAQKKDDKTVIPVEFEVMSDPAKPAEQAFGTITDAVADVTPPTVATVAPANGAAAVPTNTTVAITFSEQVEFATVITGARLEKAADSTVVAGTWAYDTALMKATFTPTAALAAATQYRVRVFGVCDIEGNKIAAEFTSTFTTA